MWGKKISRKATTHPRGAAGGGKGAKTRSGDAVGGGEECEWVDEAPTPSPSEANTTAVPTAGPHTVSPSRRPLVTLSVALTVVLVLSVTLLRPTGGGAVALTGNSGVTLAEGEGPPTTGSIAASESLPRRAESDKRTSVQTSSDTSITVAGKSNNAHEGHKQLEEQGDDSAIASVSDRHPNSKRHDHLLPIPRNDKDPFDAKHVFKEGEVDPNSNRIGLGDLLGMRARRQGASSRGAITPGSCPVGGGSSDEDTFRTHLLPVTDPQQDCSVVLENVCFKNGRPLVFVDRKSMGAVVRNGGGGSGYDTQRSPFVDAQINLEGLKPGGAVSFASSRQELDASSSHTAFMTTYQLLPPNGGIKVCNEAVKAKIRFQAIAFSPKAHAEIVAPSLKKHREEWGSKGMLFPPQTGGRTSTNNSTASHLDLLPFSSPLTDKEWRASLDACDNKVLVVPFCWELFGYHLFLCIMTMHAHMERLGVGGAFLGGGGGAGEWSSRGGVAQNQKSPQSARQQASHPQITIAIAKSSKVFPYMTGPATSWAADGTIRVGALEAMPSRTHGSGYWPLWRVLADIPANVHPDSDVPSQCFRLAIFGAPPSYQVTAAEGQRFRLAVLQRLAVKVQRMALPPAGTASLDFFTIPASLPSSPVSLTDIPTLTGVGTLIQCRSYRVVLIERAKRYKISNLAQVEGQIRCFLRGGTMAMTRVYAKGEGKGSSTSATPTKHDENGFYVNGECVFNGTTTTGSDAGVGGGGAAVPPRRAFSFQTVVLEHMPFMEQLTLAANTDLFIAVHGNGLTWTSVMPVGGAFIELWPGRAYNTNYLRFAERHNLYRRHVEAHHKCKNRCPANYAIPEEVFEGVMRHLDVVACR